MKVFNYLLSSIYALSLSSPSAVAALNLNTIKSTSLGKPTETSTQFFNINSDLNKKIFLEYLQLKESFSNSSKKDNLEKMQNIINNIKLLGLDKESYALICEVSLKAADYTEVITQKEKWTRYAASILPHCEFNPLYIDPIWKEKLSQIRKNSMIFYSINLEANQIVVAQNNHIIQTNLSEEATSYSIPALISIHDTSKNKTQSTWVNDQKDLIEAFNNWKTSTEKTNDNLNISSMDLDTKKFSISDSEESKDLNTRMKLPISPPSNNSKAWYNNKIFWSLVLGATAALAINSNQNPQNKKPVVRDGF